MAFGGEHEATWRETLQACAGVVTREQGVVTREGCHLAGDPPGGGRPLTLTLTLTQTLTLTLTPTLTLQAEGDRFVFVGGKGGVGKTTTSAALAVACAEAGHKP